MSKNLPQTGEPVLESWTHATGDVGPKGLTVERAATEDECAAVSKSFGLSSCKELRVHYTVRPKDKDRFELKGRLDAHIVQSCVITLEPIDQFLDEQLAAEFGAGVSDNAVDQDGDRAILSGPFVEPLDNKVLDVGRLCFEVLSSAIDPYPKASAAELGEIGSTGRGPEPIEPGRPEEEGPFAILAKLKDKPKM